MRWFTDEEVAGLDPELVRRLEAARGFAKVPFIITSGYREGDPRSHGRRLAVDIACTQSHNRFKMVSGLYLAGFRRIGVYDRHIHADIDERLPLDVMWWGVSK